MAGSDMRGMLIQLRPPPTFGEWYSELAPGDKDRVLDAFDRIVHTALNGRYRKLKDVTGAFTDQDARLDVIGTFWDEFDQTVMTNTAAGPVDRFCEFASAPWRAYPGSLSRLKRVIGKLLKQREREWGKPPPDDFCEEPEQADEERFVEDTTVFREAITLVIERTPADQRYVKKLALATLLYNEVGKAPSLWFDDALDADTLDSDDADPLTFGDGKLNNRAFARWANHHGVQVTEKTVVNFLDDISNAHSTVRARKDALA
jgi:hypothetical protein